MASITHTMGFLVILLVSLASNVVLGRDVPTDSKVADEKLHPEWLGHFDGTVLVPGFGRYMIPKKGHHINPFTYNPITGSDNGNGAIIPTIGGGSTGRSFIPGGDDTLLPNPGVEVPNPAGGVPTPTGP